MDDGWDPLAACPAGPRAQLRAYAALLRDFNRRVNLISRETEDHLEERHLLHVLTLTLRAFPPGSAVVDWGTGGGLPAIPLAICFPEVTVHAVDSVGKKVQAVRAMARRLGLSNLQAWQGRAEAWPGRAHYAVSRATAPLPDLWRWYVRVRLPEEPGGAAGRWKPGLICLKGGDLEEEVAALRQADPAVQVEQQALEPLLHRPYFADKYLVAVHGEPPPGTRT